MNNPCIGPDGKRYIFVVKKPDERWWVSRRLFVVSKIDASCLMGQYLRDMWYMETLCPDDIREFMIIPINKHTIFSEIATTLKSSSNHASCSDLLDIVREKYDVQCIYNFELSKHAIQKYIKDEKTDEHFAFELHDIQLPSCGPHMKLIFQARLYKTDNTPSLHITNPEFATY